MGVDTKAGKLYPYGIDTSGTLVPQGELDTGSAAVAEALNGSNLYILTSDALAMIPQRQRRTSRSLHAGQRRHAESARRNRDYRAETPPQWHW